MQLLVLKLISMGEGRLERHFQMVFYHLDLKLLILHQAFSIFGIRVHFESNYTLQLVIFYLYLKKSTQIITIFEKSINFNLKILFYFKFNSNTKCIIKVHNFLISDRNEMIHVSKCSQRGDEQDKFYFVFFFPNMFQIFVLFFISQNFSKSFSLKHIFLTQPLKHSFQTSP